MTPAIPAHERKILDVIASAGPRGISYADLAAATGLGLPTVLVMFFRLRHKALARVVGRFKVPGERQSHVLLAVRNAP